MKLSSVDLFRQIPKDLTQSTSQGVVLSMLAYLLLTTLLVMETTSFLRGTVESSVMMDSSPDAPVPLSLHMTVPALPCELLAVSLWDQSSGQKLPLVGDVHKTMVAGPQGEKVLGTWDDSDPQFANNRAAVLGEGAVAPRAGLDEAELLTSGAFQHSLEANEWSFVNFHTPWCSWCRKLSPTWEAFALTVHEKDIRVKVYKVDCEREATLCRSQAIGGYPTLRIYKRAVPVLPEFRGKRTVGDLLQWMETVTKEHAHRGAAELRALQKQEGCILVASLQVSRAPGNLVITAQSAAHDVDAAATNVTHFIHHLSFGTPLQPSVRRRLPPSILRHLAPMDDRWFVSSSAHQSHDHYAKVVSSHYRMGSSSLWGGGDTTGYQMTSASMRYGSAPKVPEVRLAYDMSPTAVLVTHGGRRWYEFLTSVVAIVGGAYTVLGLVDSAIFSVRKTVKERQGKLS